MHRAHGSGFRAFQGQMIRNGHKPTLCVVLFMVEVLVVSVATDNTGLLDIYISTSIRISKACVLRKQPHRRQAGYHVTLNPKPSTLNPKP